MHLLFFIFLFTSVYASKEDNGPIVETPLGKVKGIRQLSHGGRNFTSFEGIPYARPPTRNRRFEAPEPIEPWRGIWDARYPTVCAQTGMLEPNTTHGTEDCLHVNVYVPRETPDTKSELDVIVHIHGGAFMFGHGNAYTSPIFLMDHEVIFVTFNYRLGLLGFLSTEDNVVSGNMGLKDQVLALKWVQNNIKSFGGNPNSVTLTGLSAGGGSTHLHYFSEMSRGLFHRGYAQSGLALNDWAAQENAAENAKKLADAVGCPLSSNQVMVDCLKQRPYQQLLAKIPLFYKFMFMPIIPFGPVVEKGSKPFIADFAYNLLKAGKVLDVPLLASHTAHEGLFPTAFFLPHLETINKNWLEWAPFLLDFNHTLPSTKWLSISQKIKDYYIGEGKDISQETFMKLAEMFGDRHFYVDAEDAVLMQAAATKSPVYYYRFSYPGDENEHKTVAHGGDAKYFFGQILEGPRKLTADELKMNSFMVEMLVSYAKTGVPSLRSTIWPFTDSDKLTYADIGGYGYQDIKIRKTSNLTPREFWKSLGFLENENLYHIKDEL